MNEEKDLKHKMATMVVLMSSLFMITSARARMTRILDDLPGGAKDRFYFTAMKGNTNSYTSMRYSTFTSSEDLHDNFTNDHIFSQIDHIPSQMITFLHKHLYIMLIMIFQTSSVKKQGGNEYGINPS